MQNLVMSAVELVCGAWVHISKRFFIPIRNSLGFRTKNHENSF